MTERKMTFHLPLTVVMEKDSNAGGYTGWLKEFPNVIAEGEEDLELYNNLSIGLEHALDYTREYEEKRMVQRGPSGDGEE